MERLHINGSALEIMRLKATFLSRSISFNEGPYSVSIPIQCLGDVRDIVENIPSEAELRYDIFENHIETLVEIRSELNLSSPLSGHWLEILDEPQVEAVNKMIKPKLLGMCLFDEQGSGKTVMTIAAFDHMHGAGVIQRMIILCPKSMLSEWKKDIDRFTGINRYNILIHDDGSDSELLSSSKWSILIGGYESIRKYLSLLESIARTSEALLVVDESFYLKNSDSQRSKIALQLRQSCKKCFVLCGTPAPNSPYDVINQFNLSDNSFAFRNFKKTGNLVDDTNVIKRIIEGDGFYVRRLKTEILDHVPDKKFVIIKAKLEGRQRGMYQTARNDLVLSLRGMTNLEFKKNVRTYFQKRAALMQICAAPASVDPFYQGDHAKLVKLDDLIRDLIVVENKKVILWSFYSASIEEVVRRYREYLPLVIDGSTSAEERREAVSLFQGDPTRLLLVANPAAAGAGLTLHASSNAIYLSYSNQAAHFFQSLDRIHRRGQVSQIVTYYLLVCEGTIEESEVLRLRAKEVSQGNLLNDVNFTPTNIDEALEELKG